uniref:Putative LOC100161421 [Acyrthosiphon pisum] n=1 Tax=Lepeophtheirus salmonis TaxID=72036 RepID=A0A0K2T5C2_LEPSM
MKITSTRINLGMRTYLISTILCLTHFEVVLGADESHEIQTDSNERNEKVFSLFSIVQFNNEPCRSSMVLAGSTNTGFRNGTCFTAAECGERGGSASGSCAGGFGVCCVFMVATCGASISQNCSYIKNPNSPAALTDTSPCSFTINKCAPDVCDFRLDFEMFSISGPSSTDETNGGECRDTMMVTTPTGQRTPTICGSNSGQHIYIDVGRMPTDSASIAFQFMGAFNRMFDIKVTQIPCNSESAPPNGCLQFHTGTAGMFETFNFDGPLQQHLASQTQQVCIRQEDGFCCIDYQVCSDENSMTLGNGGIADFTKAGVGTDCSEDFIIIEGSSATGQRDLQQRYCGGKLSDVTKAEDSTAIRDCTLPFEVTFVTDNIAEAVANAKVSRGTCLKYNQVPCNAI